MMLRHVLVLNALAGFALAQAQPADRTIVAGAPALSVGFLDGGRTVAASCRDGKLRLWDAQTGASRHSGAEQEVGRVVSFLPRPNQIATVRDDGSIRLWDAAKASFAADIAAVTPRAVGVAVADDGSRVVTAHIPDRQSSVNTIRVRDVTGKDLFAASAGIGGISVLAFSPDGSTLVAGSNDADLRVWNVRNGELVRLIDELAVSMFAAAFSPDGKKFATAGADRTVYIWDTGSWKLMRKITGQPEMISSLAFSPDGRRIVTGGFSERTVAHPVSLIVWDVETAKQVRTMPVPRRVTAVAFSPSGRQIASAYGGDSLNLWRVPD